MAPIDYLYIAFNGIFILAGLALVAQATRAYLRTDDRAMIHLSLGFVLIVAAGLATATGAFLTQFSAVRSLLLVNNTFSTAGYVLVIYSLFMYG